MMNITTYGKLYGTLVLAGRRAISADDNPDNLPLVPAMFVQEAMDYMEYSATHDEKDKSETIEDRINTLEEDNVVYNDLILQLFEKG